MFGFRKSSRSSSLVPPSSECLDNNNSSVLSETNGLDQMSNSANTGRGDQGSALHSSDVNQITEDFEDDVVGCTSTFQSYCSEWEKLFVRQDYLRYVKSIGLKGGLRSSRFRSVAWKLFLGVLPEDQTLWLSKTDEWRRQYEDLKNKLIINPRNAEAKDLSINNPLSQEVEYVDEEEDCDSVEMFRASYQSPWNQFFLDNELRLTIKQDVIRTYPKIEFYHTDGIRTMMVDILFIFAKVNPEIAYRQGMHELLAPLIFVLHCDHQAFMHACEIESVGDLAKDVLNPEFLEHDAFSMFCQIMQTVDSWYVSKETLPPPPPKVSTDLSAQPFMQTQDVHPSNVIVSKLVHIQDNLLKKVDYELYDHLMKMDIAPQIYGIRWLRLLFGREFPMQDLLILWDAIFADSSTFDLVDYVFVAMLNYLKHALLTSDYPSCLRLLMKYPPISDIQYFIRKSLKLRNPQESPHLVDYFHKKPVDSGANGCDSSTADANSSAKRGSGRGSSLAQSLTSLTKISLKRPGSLGLNRSSNSILSKSTSEPMNLITDTAVSPDRVVVDLRKASTASLSLIEGALMQDPRYPGSLRANPSSQSLAHFEPDAMSSSMIEQMSAASSDGGNTSPRTGRFSFFGTRGARKSSVKAKPQKKNMDQEVTLTPSLVSNIDGTCRRCAAELDFHIGTIQKFVLRQNSFEENDEILLALAGIKQVRDVLKGVLKPSDMYSNSEVVYSGNSPGNLASSQLYRKMNSAQSSLAATPLYETATGKFFIATPDLLSSDTDINSPENGALFPEAIGIGRNASNDTIVSQDPSASEMDLNYHSKGDHCRIEATAKGHRKQTSKGNITPLETRFQKSLPETVMLLNSEVEMVELQKSQERAAHGYESKSSDLPILGAYATEKQGAARSASTATIPAQRTEIYNSVPVTATSQAGVSLLGSAAEHEQEQCGNSSQTSKLNMLKNFTSFK